MQHRDNSMIGEEVLSQRVDGQDWLVSWHCASSPPDGINHGSAALCEADGGGVVLVSEDGERFGLPGGRPEGTETLRETLDREVLEEACAQVNAATLLGFVRSECTRGHERSRIIVRAMWHASVSLLPWEPHHEMTCRIVASDEDHVVGLLPAHFRVVYFRMLHEARLVTRSRD